MTAVCHIADKAAAYELMLADDAVAIAKAKAK
jgi:hypothetical protein